MRSSRSSWLWPLVIGIGVGVLVYVVAPAPQAHPILVGCSGLDPAAIAQCQAHLAETQAAQDQLAGLYAALARFLLPATVAIVIALFVRRSIGVGRRPRAG